LRASQVFSGNIPFFQYKQDGAVILAAMRGEKPTHPTEEICHLHGLQDNIWELMQCCWKEQPSERPVATEIASIIAQLPICKADQRPVNEWDNTLPSRLSYFLTEHPFPPTFANIIEDTFIQHGLTSTFA
jgi:hypothetical protein